MFSLGIFRPNRKTQNSPHKARTQKTSPIRVINGWTRQHRCGSVFLCDMISEFDEMTHEVELCLLLVGERLCLEVKVFNPARPSCSTFFKLAGCPDIRRGQIQDRTD